MQNYELKSEIVRQWREEAIAEGVRKGREEGGAIARRRSLLAAFVARGLPIDTTTEGPIAATDDGARLARWLPRAWTVASVQEVFRE